MTSTAIVNALPPHWYCSEEIFERESTQIFAREWTAVGPSALLRETGAYLTTSIAGSPVVVVRNSDEELRGFLNICRHRASTLVETETGGGQCRNFSCPYHGWVYDLGGRLTHAPGFDDTNEFDKDAYGLIEIQVSAWNGIVFATLGKNPPALIDWLGDIETISRRFPRIDEMTFHSTIKNSGDVDWKTYSDNSAEGYHLEYVHPELSRVVAPGSEIKGWSNGKFIGFDVAYRNAEGAHTGHGFWVYKFPGLLLHFSEDGFNMERVIPLAPGRSQMQRWFWFTADAADADGAVAASTQVMHEDFGVCESVQRNLESGSAQQGASPYFGSIGTADGFCNAYPCR